MPTHTAHSCKHLKYSGQLHVKNTLCQPRLLDAPNGGMLISMSSARFKEPCLKFTPSDLESRCKLIVLVFLIQTLMFSAPVHSSSALDEQALAMAPSLQDIWIVINNTKHDSKVTWESMEISDFSCRPGYFVALRYSEPAVDETFVTSTISATKVSKFSRIPPAFDSRQTWPDRIEESAYQGPCGLCWAISWAGVLSDRFAIGYKGNFTIGKLSPGDLQSCTQRSQSCAVAPSHFEIAQQILNNGIGKLSCFGFQGSLQGQCQLECTGGERPMRYRAASVHHIGIDAGDAFQRSLEIMKEIQTNGPVVATMNVYIDFLIYKAGIYSKSQEKQRFLGKHSVKIIGWGSERGQPYWLIQNSWGSFHGEAGLARIRRGNNECGIEGEVYAPIPNFVDLIDLEYSEKLKIHLNSLQQNATASNSSSNQNQSVVNGR